MGLGRRIQVVLVAVGVLISLVAATPDESAGSLDPLADPIFEPASIDTEPGSDRVGLLDPSTGQWHLRTHGGGVASFYFGDPGDFPFMGDWNCDGLDTPGLYRQSDGYVYLRNSNTQGVADIRFFFGDPGDVPLAGDFNGDGCDTVSIYRPSEARIYVINKLGSNDGGLGAADYSYLFGNPGDKSFVGDFDSDGVDTVGLHRESTGLVYFRNSNTQGVADAQFVFGDPGDRLVAGDWGIVDGADTPAVFRPSNSVFYFRFTNTQGIADETLAFGDSHYLPVAGQWDLPAQGVGSPEIDEPTSDEDSLSGDSGEAVDGPPDGSGGGGIEVGQIGTATSPIEPPDILDGDEISSELPIFPDRGDGDFQPLWLGDTPLLSVSAKWVGSTSLPKPVGLLISYRNGVPQESCSATLVHRRFVITAAHCLVDNSYIKYNGFRFYPQHYPGVARESYWADAFFMWPSYQTWSQDTKIFLDYGMVRLTQTSGVWPGDRYGWYTVWMHTRVNSSTPKGVNYSWDEQRSVIGYPVEGSWGFYSNAATPSVYPWVCVTSDGSWFHGGGGWWLYASGCTHSGGMSGGPVFGYRDGKWRVIGVNSSGHWAVPCGPSNWPQSYPCSAGSRFSAVRNSWAAPLLNTSGSQNDFDSMWQEAFAYPG